MKSEVYNRDCLDAMREMPDKAFDLCLTDPPYGVLGETWDEFTCQEYAAFTMQWLGLVRSKGWPLVTFAGERTRQLIAPLLDMLYDNVRQLIWDKGSGGTADAGFFYCYESIYFCYPNDSWEVVRPKTNIVGNLIKQARVSKDISRSGVDIALRGKKTGLCFRWEEGACLPTPEQAERLKDLLNLNGEFSTALNLAYAERDEVKALAHGETVKRSAASQDILRFPTTSETDHPCEKPVGLMTRLLQTVGKDKKNVVDPFLGSGSTRLAAYNLGLNFTGFELNETYFNAQEERFANHIAQPKLFTPEVVPEEQMTLI